MASTSLNGTWEKPCSSGSKKRCTFSWPVAETVAMVRPWKESAAVMMSYRSGRPNVSRLYFRASLMAASFASAPLLQKKARSAKEWLQSSSASSICCGIW